MFRQKDIEILLDNCLNGDKDAFNRLAYSISNGILNIAYRYSGNLEDAKDILQAVLFKIYRKLSSFKRTSKFSTWVYRITVNTSIDLLRKKKKNAEFNDNLKVEDIPSFIDNADLNDKKAMVRGMLRELTFKQRDVFILKHYEGLTINAIAGVLGCSESSVKTHLTRAVNKIRKKLEAEL